MTHEILERPWSRVAMDIFTLESQDYLITVDFYSDFWEVDVLPDMTTATDIKRSKVHFSRYEHTTTSPYHSQANGKMESAVNISKNIIKKAKKSGHDIWKAVLDWRNTPTESMNSRPVQRFMSRRTRTHISTPHRL